jgi:hypothetical protein
VLLWACLVRAGTIAWHSHAGAKLCIVLPAICAAWRRLAPRLGAAYVVIDAGGNLDFLWAMLRCIAQMIRTAVLWAWVTMPLGALEVGVTVVGLIWGIRSGRRPRR